MAQNFLFSNLPQLKSAHEDKDILKKTKARGSSAQTRTVRGASEGIKWANKLAMASDNARRLLNDDGSIICVRDERTFFDYIKKIKDNRAGGCDTETTGLDPILDHMVGLCLYTPGEKSIYVPSRHTDLYDNVLPDQLSYEAIREGLMEIQDVPLDYHNGIFDFRVLRNSVGVDMTVGWCTQIASMYLNEYEDHRLKTLYDKYVSKGDDKSATFGELFQGIPFNYVPIDIAYLYAGKDPKITNELANYQRRFLLPNSQEAIDRELADAGRFLIEIEIPLIPYIGRMEDRGVEIDAAYGKKLETKYTIRLEEAQKEIHGVISEYDLTKLTMEQRSKLSNPINLSSPAQLAIIFYDLLGLSNGDRRAPRSTNKNALEYIRTKYPEYRDLLNRIQEYRGMGKLLSTYVIKMPLIVKEKTGRLHCRFNQFGTRTGRFSSDDPNMQNIPSRGEKKEIRKMVKVPDGRVFISADFS